MKRLMGWTLAGAMVLGSSALAEGDKKSEAQQQSSQSPGLGGSGSPEAQRAQEHQGGKQTMGDTGQPSASDDMQKSQSQEGLGSSATGGAGGTGASAQAGSQDPAQLMKQGMLPVPSDEKAFLERLYFSNQEEVKLGELAQQKASSPDVKKFGAMMVKDHGEGAQKVKDYAQKKGLTLSEGEPQPANDFEQKMVAAHKAQGEKLQALEGKVFDQAYLTAMVGAHDATLAKLTSGATQFAQSELAPMLNKMSAKVRQHREHAYKLLGKEPKAAQGVGGSGSESSEKKK